MNIAEEGKDLECLNESRNCFKNALEVFKIEEYPINYALTQSSLGDFYMIEAGLNNDSPELMENAINAYKEALKIFTEENYPQDYLYMQEKLSKAYIKLKKS